MTTLRRWTLAAIAALAALAAAAACSSSYITADGGAGGADATADESAPEAGDDASDAGACVPVPVQPPPPAHGGPACPSDASACSPKDVTSFTQAWVPPNPPHANACTTNQLAQAYTMCFNTTDGATCSSWAASNVACWECLSSSPSASRYGAGIDLGPFFLVNTPGCIALAEPCNQPCAAAFQAYVFCDSVAACDPLTPPCAVTTTSSTAYDNCTLAANSCGCSAYNAAAQCFNSLLADPGKHPAVAICGIDGGFQQRYDGIAAFMCGP